MRLKFHALVTLLNNAMTLDANFTRDFVRDLRRRGSNRSRPLTVGSEYSSPDDYKRQDLGRQVVISMRAE